MVIIYVDEISHLWDEADVQFMNHFMPVESKEDSLFVFTLLLMRAITETRFGTPDLFKHYFNNDQGISLPLVYKE